MSLLDQLDLFAEPLPKEPQQAQALTAIPSLENVPLAEGMVRLGCGTCSKRGGWTMKAGPDAGKWRVCPDCAGLRWRDVPEKEPLPADVAALTSACGYDAKAAGAMIEFTRATKPLGWHNLVTEPNPPRVWPNYPNPGRSDGKWPEPHERVARLLSAEKASRLANMILRGVASDKPRVTVECWEQALSCLPAFHRLYLDPFADPWQPPLGIHGETAFDVCEALERAFPGDLTEDEETA